MKSSNIASCNQFDLLREPVSLTTSNLENNMPELGRSVTHFNFADKH